MRASTHSVWILALIVFLVAGAASADDGPAAQPIADMEVQGGIVLWTPLLDEAMELTVAGPDGAQSLTFEVGETPSVSLLDDAGNVRSDGSYSYRLVAMPQLDGAGAGDATNGRAIELDGAEPLRLTQTGHFTIRDGLFVDPSKTEAQQQAPPSANKDFVILDDLIVDGSACIGFDCVDGENFGFDTLRLKENNLRIHFQDTSGGNFPTNDWRIIANDSTNGGLNRFSIEDSETSRLPFTIEAGAPNHALYVDDGGRIGIGTNIPTTSIHVSTGNTPTLRLEQDGSSGFQPYTWDVAGNETNFFVRDIPGGSQLPFRIRTRAPSNSIYIDTPGSIGMGTGSPDSALHVFRNDGTAKAKVEEATAAEGIYTLLELATTGGAGLDLRPRFTLSHGGVNAAWNFDILNNGNFAFIRGGGGSVFTFTSAGNLLIDGDFVSNGMTLNVPDYVFAEDYHLMPLDDVKTFIETESHLPHVPSASDITAGSFNLTEMQLTLLRKVEELTLYTLDQHDTIQRHQQSIDQQQQTIADYQQTLEDHQALIADQQEIIRELRARLDL